MTSYEKHMILALSLAAALVALNIYAVTQGLADSYYAEVTEWLKPLFSKA